MKTRRLYLVTADGGVEPQGCRTVSSTGPTGVTWHHCTCRPGVRVADPAKILHAGDVPDRVAGTVPTPRREP